MFVIFVAVLGRTLGPNLLCRRHQIQLLHPMEEVNEEQTEA